MGLHDVGLKTFGLPTVFEAIQYIRHPCIGMRFQRQRFCQPRIDQVLVARGCSAPTFEAPERSMMAQHPPNCITRTTPQLSSDHNQRLSQSRNHIVTRDGMMSLETHLGGSDSEQGHTPGRRRREFLRERQQTSGRDAHRPGMALHGSLMRGPIRPARKPARNRKPGVGQPLRQETGGFG